VVFIVFVGAKSLAPSGANPGYGPRGFINIREVSVPRVSSRTFSQTEAVNIHIYKQMHIVQTILQFLA